MTKTLDDELSEDIGMLMSALTTKYGPKAPRELGIGLARSLGLYIALAAKSPREALDEAAALIRNTPFGKLKAMHFGYQLGANDSKVLKPKLGDVVRMGPTHFRKPEQ